MANPIISVPPMSNREFLELYARPGRVGLAGGASLIDRAIRRAERHIDAEGRWSNWSHAFVFGEKRGDGHVWVIESDLAAVRKHIRFGVQENRVTKYHDEELYGSLAILDFGLPEDKTTALIRDGLDLVCDATRYSVRELFGTLLALRRPESRGGENVMSRDKSLYCSALVQHLYGKIGLELTPGVNAKHTTPEDIFRTGIPHTKYVLDRNLGESKLKAMASRLREKIKTRKAKRNPAQPASPK